jgi:hypothetical protein
MPCSATAPRLKKKKEEVHTEVTEEGFHRASREARTKLLSAPPWFSVTSV